MVKELITSKTLGIIAVIILAEMALASALAIDANYLAIYPGGQGKVDVKIDNNENFDIQDISMALNLANLPFTSVGSSEKNIDEINEDDDDKISFTIKASNDIKPGDYNIPYTIKYTNSDNDESLEKDGSFGLRVSAKTEIEFSIDVGENPIIDQQGKVSLEIINRGLGDIKAVYVEITPQGFDLLSQNKVFIGTIAADDTDSASFDVVYKSTSPVLNAKVYYKDFDNNDQTEDVNILFKVYTREEALNLGLIKKNNTWIYVIILVILIIAWFVWRRIKKRKKNNKK